MFAGNNESRTTTSSSQSMASTTRTESQLAAGAEKPRSKGRPAKVTGSPARHGVHCPVCGKMFNNSSALAKHKLTHSDERKYVCPICSKAFKRQDHL